MTADINVVMDSIPMQWRKNWCNAKYCACLGCVQIGNRLIMAKELLGCDYHGDPEYIDEEKIPQSILDKYKITKEEWDAWISKNA